jgi:hypothetical protein
VKSVRTQVYLTEEQRRRLDQLARRDRRSFAELIREAVDRYLEAAGPPIEAALDSTFGRTPDLEVPSRDEWDRG